MQLTYVYDIALPSRLAAPIQILNTAHALARRGVATTVLLRTTGPGDEAAWLAPYGLAPHPGLRLAALPRGRPADHARAALAGAPDVVMSRGDTGVRVLPALARRAPRPHLVYEAHHVGHVQVAERAAGHRPRVLGVVRTRRERRREARTLRVADGLVTISAGLTEALRDAFGPLPRTLVLPSGTARAAPPPPPGERDLDVVYAGKLEARKGIEVLLEAMALLPGRRLVVAGGDPGQVAALRARAAALGVAGRVTCTGFLPPAEVPALLRRARVGACPLPVGVAAASERFTSSLKALELLAHGVPLVASDVPAMRELVEHDRTALLVAPNDPAALARALARVLDDPALAARLAAAGRARAEDFTWERRAERLARFLAAVRGRAPGR